MARGAGERPWHLRAAVRHDAIGHAAGAQHQGTRAHLRLSAVCWLCSDSERQANENSQLLFFNNLCNDIAKKRASKMSI